MEMEGMEGAILIFMLGNMEQTVARKQTKREKNNTQKRTEGWKQKGIWLFWYAVVPVFAFYLMECYEHNRLRKCVWEHSFLIFFCLS